MISATGRTRKIYCEEILFFLLESVVCLPLNLTMDHKSRWVRILGIPWFIVWFFPAGMIFFLCAVPLLFGMLIESAWKDDPA